MMHNKERITKIIKLDLRTSVLRSSLCNDSDAYILVKGIITVAKGTPAVPNNVNMLMLIKTYYLKIVRHLVSA